MAAAAPVIMVTEPSRREAEKNSQQCSETAGETNLCEGRQTEAYRRPGTSKGKVGSRQQGKPAVGGAEGGDRREGELLAAKRGAGARRKSETPPYQPKGGGKEGRRGSHEEADSKEARRGREVEKRGGRNERDDRGGGRSNSRVKYPSQEPLCENDKERRCEGRREKKGGGREERRGEVNGEGSGEGRGNGEETQLLGVRERAQMRRKSETPPYRPGREVPLKEGRRGSGGGGEGRGRNSSQERREQGRSSSYWEEGRWGSSVQQALVKLTIGQ